MDINLNVTIKAPELVEAINNLAGAYINAHTPATVTVAPVINEQPKKSRSHKAEKPSEPAPEAEVAKAVEETAPAKEPDPAPEPEPEKPAEPAKEIKLEDVRGKLADIARSGKKDEVKKLLAEYGVSKLTEIPEDKYAELMEKAEAL